MASNNFDPANPQHVGNAMNQLNEKISALEKALASASRQPAPKLPLPEKYDGKRHLFRQFINSVKLHFSISPGRFVTDVSKTGFVASLLRGPALDWITPYLEQNDAMLSSWDSFESKFKAMFDDPHRAKTAVSKLTQLRQGRRPVVAYAAEFRRVVMDADFDNNAQVYWFRAGLSDAILDELTHTSAKSMLDDFIAQCVLIDTRLREREVERSRRSRPTIMPSSSRSSAGSTSDAMVLDSTSTSTRRGPLSAEERKRRLENDLCLYCGRAGHRKGACPLKSGNGQARRQQS